MVPTKLSFDCIMDWRPGFQCRQLTGASPAPLVRQQRHQMAIAPGATSGTTGSQARLVEYARPAKPLWQ